MNPELDDPTSALVNHDEDPMGLESERFTPERHQCATGYPFV